MNRTKPRTALIKTALTGESLYFQRSLIFSGPKKTFCALTMHVVKFFQQAHTNYDANILALSMHSANFPSRHAQINGKILALKNADLFSYIRGVITTKAAALVDF